MAQMVQRFSSKIAYRKFFALRSAICQSSEADGARLRYAVG